jgi:hypothetical protein
MLHYAPDEKSGLLAEHAWAGLGQRRAHPRSVAAGPHCQAGRRCCELVRDAQPPAMMIAVDDDSDTP